MRTIVSFEATRTLKRTGFWVVTLVVPLIMAAVIALIVVSNASAADGDDSESTAGFSFTYSDASGYVDPAVVAALGGSPAADEAQAIEDVKSGRVDAYFAYPDDPVEEPTAVYAVDEGIFANTRFPAVASEILVISAQGAIDDQVLASLARGHFAVTSTNYDEGRESAGLAEVIPPLLYLLVFYASLFLMGNLMATSVLEEKENRVSEMILTTMDPTTMVSGKIVALFIVGIVQMVVIAVPVLIGYVFFREELSLPYIDLSQLSLEPQPMIVGALLLAGGFCLFMTTLAAAGAMMPTVREAGAITAPLTIVAFAPLWALALVLEDPQSFIVQVLTFFPYTAAPTAMLRNGLGTLSTTAAVIVIVELFVLSVVMFRVAVRVFKYGSIAYSRRVSLESVFGEKG
jgi:ABC-2 type transport system permease protein